MWRLAFGCALAGVAFVSIVSFNTAPAPPQSDKLGHFIAYAVLGILGVLSFPELKRPVFFLAAGLTVYGIGLEGVQSLLPHRYAGVLDAIANAAGAAAGAGAAWAMVGRKELGRQR
ncbi:MAG: VanZ family protein [Pseudomonadota bacterium]